MPNVEPNADGTLPVTVTYLRMTEPPYKPPPPPPLVRHALLHAKNPPVGFYRYLYDAVGRDWYWVDRKRQDDATLAANVQDEQVEIYVLYVDGVPAGYAELDFRPLPEVAELAYFGLIPEFIGMKLGPFLLRAALDIAWSRDPDVVQVNTCTLDSPAALPLYQRMGFVAYDREDKLLDPKV